MVRFGFRVWLFVVRISTLIVAEPGGWLGVIVWCGLLMVNVGIARLIGCLDVRNCCLCDLSCCAVGFGVCIGVLADGCFCGFRVWVDLLVSLRVLCLGGWLLWV